MNYKIKCKNNCKNEDKDVCNNCIINLNINNISLLKGNILVNDEYIKENTYYTNIIIYYICPYCNKISSYKLSEIVEKENLIKLSINILKFMIIQSNKNELLINKLVNKNKNLELQLYDKVYYKKINNVCHIIYIIICMKMIIIFLFVFLNNYTIYIK
tara:strand:- start:769 stop:1242 length:474 start_codon:yes stop_codon:yes gene_type:complete